MVYVFYSRLYLYTEGGINTESTFDIKYEDLLIRVFDNLDQLCEKIGIHNTFNDDDDIYDLNIDPIIFNTYVRFLTDKTPILVVLSSRLPKINKKSPLYSIIVNYERDMVINKILE